jgi:hypothetical protein
VCVCVCGGGGIESICSFTPLYIFMFDSLISDLSAVKIK